MAVEKGVRYIEAHLADDIGIADVAAAAGYSLYHFSRLFQAIAGFTPHEYLYKRRLTEAALELYAGKNVKVLDIAMKYRFNSHESFTRAFRRAFGLSPVELKRKEALWHVSLVSAITAEGIEYRAQNDELKAAIVTRPAIRLVGLVTLLDGSGDMAGLLWAELRRTAALLDIRVLPAEYYRAVFSSPECGIAGSFHLFGLAVHHLEEIPYAMVGKTLPASRYACFAASGSWRSIELTRQYIFETWLPKSEYRLSHPFEFIYYGRNCPEGDNQETPAEIFIPVE